MAIISCELSVPGSDGAVHAGTRPISDAAGQCQSMRCCISLLYSCGPPAGRRLAARGRRGPVAGPGVAINEQVKSEGTLAPE